MDPYHLSPAAAERLFRRIAGCLAVCAMLVISPLRAQVLVSRSGVVSFHSATPLEKFDAENRKIYALLDPSRRAVAVSVLLREFSFERKLMEEHFNDSYVESHKFPRAVFTGQFEEELPLDRPGKYAVKVRGEITLHGVTRKLETSATLVVGLHTVEGMARFKLQPSDFDIRIPALVRSKIEHETTVRVSAIWQIPEHEQILD